MWHALKPGRNTDCKHRGAAASADLDGSSHENFENFFTGDVLALIVALIVCVEILQYKFSQLMASK